MSVITYPLNITASLGSFDCMNILLNANADPNKLGMVHKKYFTGDE